MRNLFDQYEQPENRLTHALAVCLNEDRELLSAFVSRLGIGNAPDAKRLIVDEQALPGEEGAGEADAEQRGLPDIVIHDDDSWCAFIECKVNAELSTDQLDRHRRTLERRGFGTVVQVVLTKEGVKTPQGTVAFTWPRLYEFLGAMTSESTWGLRLRDYLRAAEVRLALDGYLSEGTLTMFDGFPFSGTYPYSYGEAKRLIRLAMKELRERRDLQELRIDPSAPGRAKVTGSAESSVWDFLLLKDRPPNGNHTRYPHLTLGIHRDALMAYLTIPHGAASQVWRRLSAMSEEKWIDIHQKMHDGTQSLRARGAVITANVLQRHYPSQSHPGIWDGECTFRIDASLPGGTAETKHRPEWIKYLWSSVQNRRDWPANVQLYYAARMTWGMNGLDDCGVLGIVAEAWCAMTPLLEAVRGDGSTVR